ncbi:hypothetical protein [Nocardia sp. NPDC052566]|uniref:hypothetical protein n=1 Tax=Nocardia sp. NPDC052566 TaxID=3364330 RepID=UPI0037C735D8
MSNRTKTVLAATVLTALGFAGIGNVPAVGAGPQPPCWNGCSFPLDPNNPPSRFDPANVDPAGTLPPDSSNGHDHEPADLQHANPR